MAFLQEDLNAAEEALSRAVDVYRAVYEGKHFRVGVAMSNLASVSIARRQYTTADARLRDAIAMLEETLPANHLQTLNARLKLGRTWVGQRRYPEAEAILLETHRALSEQPNPSATALKTARDDLVALYEASGRPHEASKYRSATATAQR